MHRWILLCSLRTFSSRIIFFGQSHPDRYLWQFFQIKWFEHVFGHADKLVSVKIKLFGQIILDWLHFSLLHSNRPRTQILNKRTTYSWWTTSIVFYQVEHCPYLMIAPDLWYSFVRSSKHEHSASFLHFNGSFRSQLVS